MADPVMKVPRAVTPKATTMQKVPSAGSYARSTAPKPVAKATNTSSGVPADGRMTHGWPIKTPAIQPPHTGATERPDTPAAQKTPAGVKTPTTHPRTRATDTPVPKPVAKANTSQRTMTPAARKKAAGVKSAKAFTPAARRKANRTHRRAP